MKIHHTALTVSSLKESVNFYSEIFGLKIEAIFEKEDIGAKGILMSDSEGGKLELFEFKNPKKASDDFNDLSIKGVKHIAFESENVLEEWNKLKDRYECSDIEKGKTATYFFIKDPTGIPVEVYQKL